MDSLVDRMREFTEEFNMFCKHYKAKKIKISNNEFSFSPVSDKEFLKIKNKVADEKEKAVTHVLASKHNTVSNGEITDTTRNEDHRVLIPESNSVKESPDSCISEDILESLEAYKEKLNEGIKSLTEKIKGVEVSIEIVRKEFLKEKYSRKKEYLKDLKRKGIEPINLNNKKK